MATQPQMPSLLRLDALVSGPNGTLPVHMAIDTGATAVSIPIGIAGALGYDPYHPDNTVEIATPTGTERVHVVTLEAIEVNGAIARNVRAVCVNLPSRSSVEGLLGLSFLRNFDVDLHFKSGRIAFR